MTGDAVRRGTLRRRRCRSESNFIIFLRRAPRLVTTDTIVHRECFERTRGRPRKSFHRAMAGLTLYLRCRYVNLVGKKYVRRESPDSFPGNLLTLLAVGADFFYLFAFGIAAHVAA